MTTRKTRGGMERLLKLKIKKKDKTNEKEVKGRGGHYKMKRENTEKNQEKKKN